MTTWQDFAHAEPEFAQRVRQLFDAHRHQTIATIRAAWPDGDLFHADLTEVVHTHLDAKATALVVEWWTPAQGMRRVERA